jgi:UDP-N-acetylmuramate dehydrogenase
MKQNYNLIKLNTFGLVAKAKYFSTFDTAEALVALLQTDIAKENKLLILGGGSNVLFTQNIDALVLKNEIRGINIIQENEQEVIVACGAGESWHEFVMWCVNNNYYGAENLSLIPGTVGAAPMQNIGAYGVELESIFESLNAINLDTKETTIFNKAACKFGYRESVFKKEMKGQYIITIVTFKLSKIKNLNYSYGAIADTLASNNISDPTLKDLSDAIITIRKSKLPDPNVIGNAGSFFKNPEIKLSHFEKLKEHYSQMPFYKLENGNIKVPAAWLIEQCGWKGFEEKNIGVHKLQALVLVHYGNGNGNDILNLSSRIIKTVSQKFEIKLEREVNIY